MVDGSAGGEEVIEVRVGSLHVAGAMIERQGDALARAVGSARTAGESGLAAVPSSDLFEAFAFCWGRWSAALDSGHRAVTGAGTAARTAAAAYQRIDEQLSGRR